MEEVDILWDVFLKFTKLDLESLGLSELPPEINLLQNLQILNLGSNQLKRLPIEIGQLKALKKLNLKETEAKFEKGDFDGGCIIKKEKYEFNATVDTILGRIKERLESELQKTLFA